jgi:ferrous iron transport protein B
MTILQTPRICAGKLRWEFHEQLIEGIYTDAARIADRAVIYPGRKPRFDLDRTIDRIVTSRVWGFPDDVAAVHGVFWLTISRRECAVQPGWPGC